MNKPGSIFDEDGDDALPTLGPKPAETTAAASAPADLASKREEVEASQMRDLARETGYAGKSVYDYTAKDHRNAPRKPKTFTSNPETVLQCFKEFCKVHGVNDKEALYEALQLLGDKHNFAPLADLPAWSELRTR